MKKLSIYAKGAMIGMIAEYCLRVEFGYIQAILLTVLLSAAVIDVVQSWNWRQ